MDYSVEQYGRKAIIRGLVNSVQEYLDEAKKLNDKLISSVPESEQESAVNRFEAQLERVHQAKLEANAHLKERAEEKVSELSSAKQSKSSSRTLSQAAQMNTQNSLSRNESQTARVGRAAENTGIRKTTGGKTKA